MLKLKLIKTSQKVQTHPSSLTKFYIYAIANIGVSSLEIKTKLLYSILWQKNLREYLVLFLSFIIFEDYMSGERSKEMHVHIDGKQNEKILSHMKIKHVGV
jgi:hypothetical protein